MAPLGWLGRKTSTQAKVRVEQMLCRNLSSSLCEYSCYNQRFSGPFELFKLLGFYLKTATLNIPQSLCIFLYITRSAIFLISMLNCCFYLQKLPFCRILFTFLTYLWHGNYYNTLYRIFYSVVYNLIQKQNICPSIQSICSDTILMFIPSNKFMVEVRLAPVSSDKIFFFL